MKHRWSLPTGQSFPSDATGKITLTDRAGGVYDEFEGEISADARHIDWLVQPELLSEVPSGANFETFITYDDNIHKVQYGRVVRREVAFPLNPVNIPTPPYMFEDDMQRSHVGPRWVSKYGRVAMHDSNEDGVYGMGARNNVSLFGANLTMWEKASVLWYAPMNGDTVEITVRMCDGGDGSTTIVLCSDYAMKKFMGVNFNDPESGTDTIRVVTSVNGMDNLVIQGSSVNHVVPAAPGNLYTLRYSIASNTLQCFINDDTTPTLSWTDTSNIIPHGLGRRYVGGIWKAGFVNPGPLLHYFKARDVV